MTEPQAYHFEGVRSSTASEDGKFILFTTQSAAGEVRFAVSIDEIPRVIAALARAAQIAYRNSGGRPTTSRVLPAHACELIESTGRPDAVALNVVLEPNGLGIPFLLSKERFAGFAEDVLNRLAPERLAKPAIPPSGAAN